MESLIQGNFSGDLSIGSNYKFYVSQFEVQYVFARDTTPHTMVTFPFTPTYMVIIWEWLTTANGSFVSPTTDISDNWKRYRGSVDIFTPGNMSFSFTEPHAGNTIRVAVSGSSFIWTGSDAPYARTWGRGAYIILTKK